VPGRGDQGGARRHLFHAPGAGGPRAPDAGGPWRGLLLRHAATLDALERDGQVLFRYVDDDGNPAGVEDRENPNGSLRAIAGVINAAGNVAGLMPHPERAADALLGSDDGMLVLRSLVEAAAERAQGGSAIGDGVAARAMTMATGTGQ